MSLKEQVTRLANWYDGELNNLFGEGREALISLDIAVANWANATVTHRQAGERWNEAKDRLELVRAEVVQDAVLGGEIAGKNSDERERATMILLESRRKTGGMYSEALDEFNTARIATDQAAMEEAIHEQKMKAARARCAVVEAMLRAFAD